MTFAQEFGWFLTFLIGGTVLIHIPYWIFLAVKGRSYHRIKRGIESDIEGVRWKRPPVHEYGERPLLLFGRGRSCTEKKHKDFGQSESVALGARKGPPPPDMVY